MRRAEPTDRQVGSNCGNFFTLSLPDCWRSRHRFQFICMPSQPSAVLHPAFSSRNAISGDTPLCSFKRSDRALRVTPRCSAASLTVRPRGFKQDFADHFAGMGGVGHCHGSSFRRSVVVDQIKVGHRPRRRRRRQAANCPTPKPPIVPWLALQGMKPESRIVQAGRTCGGVELGQQDAKLRSIISS